VAGRAEGNEILIGIVAQLAPVLDVMDLEIRHGAARLTFPAVPLQNGPV
jgi:hypothetical protein